MRQEALRAAVDVGKKLALPIDALEVVAERSNLIVRYRPAPIVARVSGMTARVRKGDAWLRREIDVATYSTLTSGGGLIHC